MLKMASALEKKRPFFKKPNHFQFAIEFCIVIIDLQVVNHHVSKERKLEEGIDD